MTNDPNPYQHLLPYLGGQCEGILYRLILGAVEWNTGTTKYFNGTGSNANWITPDPYPYSVYNLAGPLPQGGFTWEVDETFPSYSVFKLLWNGQSTGVRWASGDRQPPTSTFVAHIERTDNQPDNCGNLPNIPIPTERLAQSSISIELAVFLAVVGR
ncbi:hypothetical protein V2H45_12720 [Tumidithrix elongata RA019]|uniref:Uncharacterized protein n=1 Tax=Tumidithrix elongata BACA0141 TaxID=2716417 RepID=A0AAW9PT25_9CYAN|nr:hypothetical protein [Tumidithrix elongata RA019]